VQVCASLLSHGAHLDVADAYGRTPLLSACQRGQHAAALLMLQNGADVEAAGHDAATAVQLAAAGGHTALVSELVAARAIVDAVDTDGGAAPH
jgi:ankyrin repeat protein